MFATKHEKYRFCPHVRCPPVFVSDKHLPGIRAMDSKPPRSHTPTTHKCGVVEHFKYSLHSLRIPLQSNNIAKRSRICRDRPPDSHAPPWSCGMTTRSRSTHTTESNEDKYSYRRRVARRTAEVEVVTEDRVAQEREQLVYDRQRAVEQILDRHDTYVRCSLSGIFVRNQHLYRFGRHSI